MRRFPGPDVAGDVSFVKRFVDTEAADMKLATCHYYRGGARNPNATMDRLLLQRRRLRRAPDAAPRR